MQESRCEKRISMKDRKRAQEARIFIQAERKSANKQQQDSKKAKRAKEAMAKEKIAERAEKDGSGKKAAASIPIRARKDVHLGQRVL
ncbi:hypothetical protein GQ54DRAFT_299414 [Martensiomyces pterosporus]|nr:hypothetical protein GQ54DRAFT_299414 [Martensiomyces pterosporus]